MCRRMSCEQARYRGSVPPLRLRVVTDLPAATYTVEQLAELFPDTDEALVLRFWTYHRNHPDVFEEFRQRARQMKSAGRKRYSGWIIVNRIRWDHDLRVEGEPFKINNDYIALYARLLIAEDPSFAGFFELRRMKPAGRRMSQEEISRRSTLDDPEPGRW